MSDFSKILVANRGEIAIRIMRAANEMGKKTVAVFAEEDKLGLHRFKADEAYRIGHGLGPVAAYLSIDEIIRVAKQSGADVIHPGYGLLSENPDFVDACDAAGIRFIGPKAATMRALGDKASARKVAVAAGVPVIPATEGLGDDIAGIFYPPTLDQRGQQFFTVLEKPVEAGSRQPQLLGQRHHPHGVDAALDQAFVGSIEPPFQGPSPTGFYCFGLFVHGSILIVHRIPRKRNVHLCPVC